MIFHSKKLISAGILAMMGGVSFSGAQMIAYAADSGTGQAQVTYNVNTIVPDDPTANPDFTVLIPTEYKLSDSKKMSAGSVELKDAQDITQNYAGDKTIKITVSSKKNFQFDNGGIYKLVDDSGNALAAELSLNKTTTSTVANAKLDKSGTKTAASDMLTFNYTVAP
ncbi:hypothetical protein [Enterococcus avium]|uniref:hypothetical protein n=1 Tax=Enterococcus avium TaxID=33945 RepID=UPI001F5A222B|nr:hypothetical protein [Enterococcus avium]